MLDRWHHMLSWDNVVLHQVEIFLKNTCNFFKSVWEHEDNTFKEVVCLWNTPIQQVTPGTASLAVLPWERSQLLLIHVPLEESHLLRCSKALTLRGICAFIFLLVFIKVMLSLFKKKKKRQEVSLSVIGRSYPCNFRVTIKTQMFRPVPELTYFPTSPFSRALCHKLFATTQPNLPVLILLLCAQPLNFPPPPAPGWSQRQGQDPWMVSSRVEQDDGVGMGSTALLSIRQHLKRNNFLSHWLIFRQEEPEACANVQAHVSPELFSVLCLFLELIQMEGSQ